VLLPTALRHVVPVPVGVRTAASLGAQALDWDRLAAEKARLACSSRALREPP